MGKFSSTLLSKRLTPCPFCGDIHPEVQSGPCQHTRPELGMFQAQVHCGHCGATGTRFCGEEDLGEAEIKAAQEWVRASTPKRGLLKEISDVNKGGFAAAVGALFAVLWLPEDFSPNIFYGILVGSIATGVVLGFIEGRATYRREVAQWEKMKERVKD